MITINNYSMRWAEIDFEQLPSPLQKGHGLTVSALENGAAAYRSNATVARVVDSYLEKLNEYVRAHPEVVKGASKPAARPAVAKKPAATKKPAAKKAAAPKPASKPASQPAAKPKQMEIPLNEVQRVEMIPLEISFIRRYASMHGKVKTRKQLLTLLSSLQKAMLEKRIRKSSPYASEVMQVQEQLSAAVNRMGEAAEISIAAASLERYRSIASSKRISESVALLKRYLLLHGRPGVQERAERLAAAIKKAVKQQKVAKDDPYAQRLEAAYKSLTSYLEKQSEVPAIASGELNGMLGLVGKKAAVGSGPINIKGETLASRELLRMEFETIGLRGRFRELIGDPSVGFTAMVFGKPKSGKSTLMLRFAHHLAVHHGRVLYCAIEEGYGYTLKEKIERLGAAHERLVFSDRLPKQLAGYDFVFIDSVSKAGLELEDLVKLKKRHPRTSFIFVFHSTKDGRFRGGNEMAHEVDVIVEVESGLAKASGRFLAGGEMRV